jgi:hypothetical protein
MCKCVCLDALTQIYYDARSTEYEMYVKNYNFACCFVWVWNLVAHIEGGT